MTYKIIKIIPLAAMILCVLAGCISGVQPPDSYTDRNGKTTVFQTDSEACTQSCNDDYARCMDADTIQRSGVNSPPGMFGASADCHNSLKDCLPSCKGR